MCATPVVFAVEGLSKSANREAVTLALTLVKYPSTGEVFSSTRMLFVDYHLPPVVRGRLIKIEDHVRAFLRELAKWKRDAQYWFIENSLMFECLLEKSVDDLRIGGRAKSIENDGFVRGEAATGGRDNPEGNVANARLLTSGAAGGPGREPVEETCRVRAVRRSAGTMIHKTRGESVRGLVFVKPKMFYVKVTAVEYY
ncbi:hypothetical protein EDB86DRAFT_2833368 [Lactarius hatsudake]|nr:hypothetical protein EDB86DRAFT_2833368 [Lactarius hatsudake]